MNDQKAEHSSDEYYGTGDVPGEIALTLLLKDPITYNALPPMDLFVLCTSDLSRSSPEQQLWRPLHHFLVQLPLLHTSSANYGPSSGSHSTQPKALTTR